MTVRLIDADALLQRWNNLLPRMARDKDGAVPIDFCLAIHEVSVTPTLTLDDLRPKGRWKDGTCTNCGQVDFSKPNFCSNCGVDMRGGGEEEME
jgi:hypothetical protein